jgi:hypothetical protein
MKKVLLVLVVLALTTLACGSGNTLVPVPTYPPLPTYTPYPTQVPLQPTQKQAPAGGSVLDKVDSIFVPYGFYRDAYDTRGNNSCKRDYCIHYGISSAPDFTGSFYVDDGKWEGIVVSMPVGTDDATTKAAGTFTAYALIYAGVTQSEMDCMTSMTSETEKTCGSIYIRIGTFDVGGVPYMFVAVSPTAAYGPSI